MIKLSVLCWFSCLTTVNGKQHNECSDFSSLFSNEQAITQLVQWLLYFLKLLS